MVKLIVVDDDLDTAETFAEHLLLKGFQVLDIGLNGKKAVELYREFHPDVVLMDVMMPGSDGFYGLEKIREFDPESKIVFVTADLKSETEKRLIENHASAIVYKPYEIENITKTINDVYQGTFELS